MQSGVALRNKKHPDGSAMSKESAKERCVVRVFITIITTPAWKNPNPKRKRETMMVRITVMIIQELMRGYEAARSKLTAQMEVVKTLQRHSTRKAK